MQQPRSANLAKITRPSLSKILDRERLFDRLDQCRERPIVWISAPAGAGKTTLVSSYLDSRKLPCLWYQADEGDQDPAAFFYYLELAAQKATPRKRKSLPVFRPEYLGGLGAFTRKFFESLFDRLGPSFLLVFDNYQEIPADSEFQELMRVHRCLMAG